MKQDLRCRGGTEGEDGEDAQVSESDIPLSQMYHQSKSRRHLTDPSIAELQAAHGPFKVDIWRPDENWEIAPVPAAHLQSQLDKSMVWSTRRIAHIFDSGWLAGYFRGKWGGRLENKDKYIVSYPFVGRYAHQLNLSEYGADKVWVVLQKSKKT